MNDKAKAAHMVELSNQISKCANEIVAGLDTASAEELLLKLAQKNSSKAQIDKIRMIAWSDRVYDIRRHREKVFKNDDLFADPGWDILLDLFSAHLKGKKISVTSACLAASVPSTTALRWMTVLEEAGLIEREKDSVDARRTFVKLTPEAIAKLTKVEEEIP